MKYDTRSTLEYDLHVTALTMVNESVKWCEHFDEMAQRGLLINSSIAGKAMKNNGIYEMYTEFSHEQRKFFRILLNKEVAHQRGLTDGRQDLNHEEMRRILIALVEPVRWAVPEGYAAGDYAVAIGTDATSLSFKLKEDVMSFERTNPVMVGNVDITTASQDTLVSIVRGIDKQLKEDEDMAKCSKKFQQIAEELNGTKALVLKQIDGDAK